MFVSELLEKECLKYISLWWHPALV